MSLSSGDQMKWQKWQKGQDWLVIAAEMAWNVMIRNDIDLAMTLSLSGPLSRSLALSLWPSLSRSLALALSLSLSRSLALSLAISLSLSLSRSRYLALALSLSLWLFLSLCHTSLEIIFATREQRLFHGTVGKKSIDTSGRNDIFHNTDLVSFSTLKEL